MSNHNKLIEQAYCDFDSKRKNGNINERSCFKEIVERLIAKISDNNEKHKWIEAYKRLKQQ